jgi:BirA family biotin operon repressor/biotin-[acetyl-CoA-carboxylase] ligase
MATSHHLHWGAEALWLELQPLLPGLSVEVVASMGSTNTELLARARQSNTVRGAPRTAEGSDAAHQLSRREADTQPCLLVAEQQTQGRGRQGKAWQSSIGASLTFSLSLPLAPADWSGLSLAIGLALAETLDPPQGDQPPRLGIKWPNDLLLMDDRDPAAPIGRKLGGILIETVQVGSQRLAVIGIGLNLLPMPPVADAPKLNWGYACLQELDYGITAPAALARVAAPLVRALKAFEAEGFAPLQAGFARRDVLAGRELVTSLPTLPQGRADGVDAHGTLWLQVGHERLPLSSGEVSLRPQAPTAAGVG